MSLENDTLATERQVQQVTVETSAPVDGGADDDAALEAAWGRMTEEDAPSPAVERGEDGKFKAKDADPVAAAPVEQEAQPEAKVTLTANMPQDMADVIADLAPEKAGKLTAWADKLHRQMSDQGRQLASLRPMDEVVKQFPEYFGHDKANPPAQAFASLLQAQKRLDSDPVAGIRWLADHYGIADQVFSGANAVSSEAAQLRQTIGELRQQISAMASPDAIRSQVNATLSERTALDEVSRFAQSKPLFADVEAVMPDFIPMARRSAGEGAAATAVLELAYDMAVNALPETRAKVQAAAKPAAEPDPKRAEAAKRAASINVKSSPSGQPRYASEDEAMNAIYDRMHSA